MTMAQLAAQYLQINRPDLTLQLTQHLLQLGNKTAQVYYYDGLAQEQMGNAARRPTTSSKPRTSIPPTWACSRSSPRCTSRAKRYNDAERIAKRAVTFNKTDPGALMTLGSVYAAEQHFDDARAQFEAALVLNPKDTAPIFQIATTYAQQNNIPMALQTIDRALAIDPTQRPGARLQGRSLRPASTTTSEAAAAYDDAVVAAPTDDEKVAILVRKASYFITEKKDAQGVAILQQIVTQFPKVPAGFVAYGDYFATQHQYDKAVAQWQAALAARSRQRRVR